MYSEKIATLQLAIYFFLLKHYFFISVYFKIKFNVGCVISVLGEELIIPFRDANQLILG